MALIRMMKPEMDFDAESINDRISRIEERLWAAAGKI